MARARWVNVGSALAVRDANWASGARKRGGRAPTALCLRIAPQVVQDVLGGGPGCCEMQCAMDVHETILILSTLCNRHKERLLRVQDADALVGRVGSRYMTHHP